MNNNNTLEFYITLVVILVIIVSIYSYSNRTEGFDTQYYYNLNWTDPSLTERVNEYKTLAYVNNSKNVCNNDKKCDKTYLSYSMSCDYTDNAHPHCVDNHDMSFGFKRFTSSI